MPASAHSDERCRRSRRVACSRAISTSGRGSLEGAQGISAAGRSEGSTHRRPLLLLSVEEVMPADAAVVDRGPCSGCRTVVRQRFSSGAAR